MPAVVMLARSRSSALARSMLAGQSSDGIFCPLTGAGVSAGMPGGYTTPVQRRESSLTLSYRPRVHPAQLLDRNEKACSISAPRSLSLGPAFLLVCVGSKDYPQGPCQGPADVPSAPHARSTRDRDAQ